MRGNFKPFRMTIYLSNGEERKAVWNLQDGVYITRIASDGGEFMPADSNLQMITDALLLDDDLR